MSARKKSSAARLQHLLEAQVGRGGVHNVVAAMQSYDRRLDFVGAAGIADPATGAAMTCDTPYFIASVSKTFTAAVAMQLCDEKRIELEAPIGKYLPQTLTRGIHVYKGTDYSGRIAVSQLLDQSSGLADHESDKPRGGRSLMQDLKAGRDRAVNTPEAMEMVRGLTPRFPPGTSGRAHYSNANYRLLGALIESVTEQPMAVNYEQRICRRIGLRHTYLFDWTAPRADQTPATFYFQDSPANVPKYLSSNTSDGGLVSTASECVSFLRAFFEGGLFEKRHLERMTQWNSLFFPLRYGCGLMYFKLPRFFWPTALPEFIGHSGSTGSFAFTCPSRGLYLAGTLNQVASPQRPYFLMIDLVRAAR